MPSPTACDGAFNVGSERGSWGMLYAREFDTVCRECKSSEAVIYASLVSMRNAKTMATPPVGAALVMEKTGMPRRTVFRCLSALIAKGLLTKERKGARAVYGFPLVDGKVPPAALESATSGTQHKRHKK